MILACKDGKPYLKEKITNQSTNPQNSENHNPRIIKIMVTGGADCGKTCLASSEIQEAYMPTIGVDFKIYKH